MKLHTKNKTMETHAIHMEPCDQCGYEMGGARAKRLWYYSSDDLVKWLCDDCHPEKAPNESLA